jgi:hypothetical protein
VKRWLAQWDVSEDEPTWIQVILAGVLFLLLMIVFPFLLVLTAAALDLLPVAAR